MSLLGVRLDASTGQSPLSRASAGNDVHTLNHKIAALRSQGRASGWALTRHCDCMTLKKIAALRSQ